MHQSRTILRAGSMKLNQILGRFILFGLILAPLIFTGCCQYPWPSLSDMRWFQIISLLNPLTYVSEGMRAALVTNVPHIPSWLCAMVLVVVVAALSGLGIRGFLRRAID